jgi:hypothetical protein
MGNRSGELQGEAGWCGMASEMNNGGVALEKTGSSDAWAVEGTGPP